MKEERSEDEVCERKNRPKDASEAFDSLLQSVGNIGVWQWRVVALCSLSGFFLAFPSMGAVFLAATPDHSCDLPFLSMDLSNSSSTSLGEIKNFTTPWVTSKDGTPTLSSCFYYDRAYDQIEINSLSSLNSSGNSSSNYYQVIDTHQGGEESLKQLKCSSWKYDASTFKSTVVTEWNLVCDDKWKRSIIQSTYMLGILTGGLFSSAISDSFGRRTSGICCAITFMISSILTIFSNSLGLFIFFRFITGASGIGMFITNFVLVIEISGKKYRNMIGYFMGIHFMPGCMLLTLQAYYLRDWKPLQISISVPTLLLLSWWFMPESPRWLLMQGKFTEGIELLKQIGRVNGGKELPCEEEVDYALDLIKKEVITEQRGKENSFSDKLVQFSKRVLMLFRTPNMRRRSLIVCYSWFVISMSYYGVAFGGENINVSLYNLAWIGPFIEIPGKYCTYLAAVRFGRRYTLFTLMCSAGACCVFIILVPLHIGWLRLVFALLGRMFLGGAFTTVYFFASELVPTNIRNISMGMANMNARIGSAITPFILDLLGNVYYAIPSTIFGILALLAGFLALLLPETSGVGLPESIEEIEKLPR